MEIIKLNRQALSKALRAVKAGQVVVCPTDTVYGFLADKENKKAVEKIYKIKKRPRSKPLPVFVRDLKMAKQLAEINKKQEKILKKYWFSSPKPRGEGGPGKFTFVLKAKSKKLKAKNTIAIRIPKHKFLLALLKKINRPLAQTSVNISGQPAMTKIKEIIEKFRSTSGVDLIIDGGNLPKRKPSAIMDLTQNEIKFLRK